MSANLKGMDGILYFLKSGFEGWVRTHRYRQGSCPKKAPGLWGISCDLLNTRWATICSFESLLPEKLHVKLQENPVTFFLIHHF